MSDVNTTEAPATILMTVETFAAATGLEKAVAGATLKGLASLGVVNEVEGGLPPSVEIKDGVFIKGKGAAKLLYEVPREMVVKIPAHIESVVIPKFSTVKKVVKVDYILEDEDDDTDTEAVA